MESHRSLIFLLLSVICFTNAQENAQRGIPESLMECYTDPILIQRDYRLPSTLNMLLDLIRKAENNIDGKNMDMKNIVSSLVHRFRLDGIVKATNIPASSKVVPYSPKAYQFDKHRLLLANLVPSSAQFPNASLTAVERCSLHHMMSSSIEKQVRGDEGTVCNKLSQYRTERLPRQVRRLSDVEVLDRTVVNKLNTMGQMKMAVDNTDDDVSSDVFPGVYASGMDTPKSQCPVEDGVIQTQWGAVAVGPLLSGLAAGLAPQRVTIRDLIGKGTGDLTYATTIDVDNKFAATIAGDLAEAALRQGPVNSKVNIGAAGGWNSTQASKWYFLNQASDNEMTDAEIRGGLDGLILATNIAKFMSNAPNMKLSQLLDAYYSQRGVFTDTIRACNRKALMTDVAPTETLMNQVLGFSYVLDKEMLSQGTIREDGFKEYSTLAVQSLNSYLPSGLNDLTCSASATTDVNIKVEASTDIYLVLDTSWSYNTIYPSITYLIDALNVSPIGSNVTLLSGKEGKIIVNRTNSPSTFQQLYNESIHLQVPMGLDIPKGLLAVKELLKEQMNNDSVTTNAGGRSTTILFVTGPSTVNDADINYSIEQLKFMYQDLPDVNLFFLVSGTKDRFNLLVKNPTKDIFSLQVSSTESTASQINEVVKRIKDVPRRLTNHRCGANWKATSSGSSVYYGYVTPGLINYYRVSPNYFFRLENNAAVKVQGSGFGSLTVCYSRSVELPKANSSTGNEGITCNPLTTNAVEISLNGACSGNDFIHKCDPLYISVEATATSDTSQNTKCVDRDCRYADSVKFTVNLQELGCFSGASQMIINMTLLLGSLLLMIKSVL